MDRPSRRHLLAACAALALFAVAPGGGRAQTPAPVRAPVAAATAADKALLGKVEAYLNSITTLRARFLQVTSQGDLARGTFYLRRPGRLRVEYDPPSPVLIVADGFRLIYYDKELNTVNMVPLDDTLAAFLARKTISFGDDVTVTHLIHKDGAVRVTLVKKGEPENGSLTLVFDETPLRLRLWVVTDAQGTQTRVALQEPDFGVKLSDDLFDAPNPDDHRNWAHPQ